MLAFQDLGGQTGLVWAPLARKDERNPCELCRCRDFLDALDRPRLRLSVPGAGVVVINQEMPCVVENDQDPSGRVLKVANDPDTFKFALLRPALHLGENDFQHRGALGWSEANGCCLLRLERVQLVHAAPTVNGVDLHVGRSLTCQGTEQQRLPRAGVTRQQQVSVRRGGVDELLFDRFGIVKHIVGPYGMGPKDEAEVSGSSWYRCGVWSGCRDACPGDHSAELLEDRHAPEHAQIASPRASAAGKVRPCAAHMPDMPKKTKALPPVGPELVGPLTAILLDRGPEISRWPADEAAAYRDNGRFLEGREAVQRLRIAKAAAAIEEVFSAAIEAAQLKGYRDGVSDAQAMTGFTDETRQAIFEKEGLTDVDLDGNPIQ